MRRYLTIIAIALCYLLVSYLLVGFKSDQLVVIAIFSTLYLATPVSRKFILGFSIFIVYWIIYDYMKAFPNYLYCQVHIQSLYDFEKSVFGITSSDGTILTPNEYLDKHSVTIMNILSGVFYLCWVPVPLAFAAYLFFKDRMVFLKFALTFLLVNLMGFTIYYLYPAAPPWYVQNYGFDFISSTPGNTAGLAHFDEFFHISLFHSMYAKSSNVFAAMPSLHSSYPLIVLYYGLKAKLGWINVLFATVAVGIWFSAVYTYHHYALDVLAGIGCALIAILLFNFLITRVRLVQDFLMKYSEMIS